MKKLIKTYYLEYKKKGFKKFLYDVFIDADEPPTHKIQAAALGIFIGLSPFWGFQSILAIVFATLFKRNKLITFAASNISFPPLIPVIILSSFKIGFFVLGMNFELNQTSLGMVDHKLILNYIQPFLIGSFILAGFCSLTTLLIGYGILFLKKHRISP